MTNEKPVEQPSRLARVLHTRDAVIIGMGSMVGAGVFSAIGPATGAAGTAALVALALAGCVAYLNATSSAQLAVRYPVSGGTYAYARARLGNLWGFLAGCAFLAGKTASCAAMALTLATYATPSAVRPVAVGAVALLTAINYMGVRKTALATRAILCAVLASLLCAIGAIALGGEADPERLLPLHSPAGLPGILQAAGFLFFAFAGYARIATLGEEVVTPERTIPRAVPLALSLTLAIYLSVCVAVLAAVPATEIARAEAPLVAAVEAGRLGGFAPLVRAGAAVASLGVLLSLLAGMARTTFAMASEGDLPSFLGATHPRHQVPHSATLVVGALVMLMTMTAALSEAIGFSSFTVLAYYALTNAAAFTLGGAERRRSRARAAVGLLGCLVLSFSLPLSAVAGGLAVLGIAAVAFGLKQLFA